jgi:hypothetical protein
MDVVGGVASIITLIEATGVLAKVSRDLVLRWRNAPHEIQALATRLSLLAGELQSIKNATARSHPVLTDAIIRQSLSDLLTDVRKRLANLESLHFRLQQHGAMRQKVEWAAKAGSVEKMLSKTQELEQRLANLMTLISLLVTGAFSRMRHIADTLQAGTNTHLGGLGQNRTDGLYACNRSSDPCACGPSNTMRHCCAWQHNIVLWIWDYSKTHPCIEAMDTGQKLGALGLTRITPHYEKRHKL